VKTELKVLLELWVN